MGSADFFPWEGKIFQFPMGAKTYYLPKKHQKDTILLRKFLKLKAILSNSVGETRSLPHTPLFQRLYFSDCFESKFGRIKQLHSL
jgi:hypothetical protein